MDLSQLIPHRAPMLLIDKVSEYDLKGRCIEAFRTIREDDFFLQGHYPDFKLVPGIITCEMLFQTGAVLIAQLLKDGEIKDSSAKDSSGVPVITRSDNIKFKNMIFPEDNVQLKVELVENIGSAFYLKGRALVNNKLAVSINFTCMMAPRPQKELSS